MRGTGSTDYAVEDVFVPDRFVATVAPLMGKARSRVDASRDTLWAAASAAYDDVERSGELLSVESKIRLQLAVAFAAETCAEAVRWVAFCG
jgi:hypothetical protein